MQFDQSSTPVTRPSLDQDVERMEVAVADRERLRLRRAARGQPVDDGPQTGMPDRHGPQRRRTLYGPGRRRLRAAPPEGARHRCGVEAVQRGMGLPQHLGRPGPRAQQVAAGQEVQDEECAAEDRRVGARQMDAGRRIALARQGVLHHALLDDPGGAVPPGEPAQHQRAIEAGRRARQSETPDVGGRPSLHPSRRVRVTDPVVAERAAQTGEQPSRQGVRSRRRRKGHPMEKRPSTAGNAP